MSKDKIETLYVAGPMSGIPQFNHPLFNEVAAFLRTNYPNVINPAELDSPEMRHLAMQSEDGDPIPLTETCNETWGDVLARDVKVIANTVTKIVLLPKWEHSRGAQLEAFVGLLVDVEFRIWMEGNQDPQLWYMSPETVRRLINER